MKESKILYPSSVLSQYIKYYWVLKTDEVEPVMVQTIPSGCVHLVFHRGENLNIQSKGLQPKNFIRGQFSTYGSLISKGNIDMLAVIFHPLGLNSFVPCSMNELYNHYMNILLHKKNFIKRVDVDINATGDDIDIVLYSKSDKIIDKSSLSMGERQMYASALLSSLVDESEIEFPVFIDSPMQKFDEQHAENIIRYFYPNVSKQVVIFPLINKELTEKEYSILLPKVCRAYLIDNISTDSSEFVETSSEKFIEKYNQKYNAD